MTGAVELLFHAIAEAEPGAKWQAAFRRHWPDYRRWHLSHGTEARHGFAAGRAKLRRHMPELVRTYERLCELTAGEEHAAGFLSLYRPPPFLAGCSQLARVQGQPMLLRNYDFDPARCEGSLLLSAWHGQRVLAMTDCLWGALDGVNEAGLAASLAFGGRKVVGDGFGVPLLLRYVLEFCERTRDAAAELARLPSHMAYNVTLLDREGDVATVMLSPDRPAVVTRRAVAANHQGVAEWQEHARFTRSVEREQFLETKAAAFSRDEARLLAAFLTWPLYATDYGQAFGTLYTAAYWPGEGRMSLYWPGSSLDQSIAAFREGEHLARYDRSAASASSARDLFAVKSNRY
jgi:predicted choloylglycine hydrolase